MDILEVFEKLWGTPPCTKGVVVLGRNRALTLANAKRYIAARGRLWAHDAGCLVVGMPGSVHQALRAHLGLLPGPIFFETDRALSYLEPDRAAHALLEIATKATQYAEHLEAQ